MKEIKQRIETNYGVVAGINNGCISVRPCAKAPDKDACEVSPESPKQRHNMPNLPQFKIAVTFRSTYDGIVQPTCEALLEHGYDRSDIFYYPWHQALVGGVGSDETLRRIYHDRSDFVVVLLSPNYAEGNWTGNVEWRAVQNLINTGDANRICLLSVDGVDVGSIPGLYATSDIAIAIDDMTPDEVAQTIVEWIAPRR